MSAEHIGAEKRHGTAVRPQGDAHLDAPARH